MRTEIVYFAGGCFWCTEAVFRQAEGVLSVTPGYTGGQTPDPTYEQVCSGKTGHAEAIRVEYNPSRISFETLLDIFWRSHDPTQMNRQGADVGTQYRSAIFCTTDAQASAARLSKERLIRDGVRVVTEIAPAGPFYPAEDYHRNYYERNPNAPYCRWVIAPKLKKLSVAVSASNPNTR
jgi:peptide-methionine (S)-S-oxide reductase